MKKIIRQILNDISGPSKNGLPVDSGKITAVPPVAAEQTGNEVAIKVHDAVPGGPNLGNLDHNPKFEAPLPEDLSNQTLSEDPAERLKQLDYQAHQSEVKQTS